MRTIATIALSILLSGHILAQAQLERYLQLAESNNPLIQAHYKKYLASLERIPQAKALPDPSVGLSVFAQSVETRVGPQRASLSINQSFPWFGTLENRSKLQSGLSDVEYQHYENAKLLLNKEVKVLYQELLYLQKAISLTEENLKLLQSFKELARVNFESGKTAFVDVLRAEIDEKEVINNLGFLQDSHSFMIEEFENLLDADLSGKVAYPANNWLEVLDRDKLGLVDSLQANNPTLKAMTTEVEAQQLELELARLSGMPSFNIGATYVNVGERSDMDVPSNGRDAFMLPQIGLKIPINRNKVKAREKEVELMLESKSLIIENQLNSLQSELSMQLRNYQDANRQMTLYANLENLAERSLALLQTEFTTGETDFVELLRMERKKLSYQLAMERAQADYNIAIYQIDYLTGKR